MPPAPSADQRLRRSERPGARGFTLLELLVALALFAVAAALSYGGLRQILSAQAQLQPRLDADLALYRAASLLADDLRFAAPRPVRDALGGTQPALRAASGNEVVLSLVRREPALGLLADQPTLVRVDWRLRGDTLWREAWPVLDAATGTRPLAREILTGVQALSLDFREARVDAAWTPYWPPPTLAGPNAVATLPRGASFVLTLADGRSLRRVLFVREGS